MRTLNAGPNQKYFGTGRGITLIEEKVSGVLGKIDVSLILSFLISMNATSPTFYKTAFWETAPYTGSRNADREKARNKIY